MSISPNVLLYAPTTLNLEKNFPMGYVRLTWANDDKNVLSSLANIVQRKTQGDAEYTDIAELDKTSTTYDDSDNLIEGTTYVYRIKLAGDGISAQPVYTAERSILFNSGISGPQTPPAPPSTVSAQVNQLSGIVRVYINDQAANETTFSVIRMRYGVEQSTDTIGAHSGTGLFFYDEESALLPGEYFYRVSATNEFGSSAYVQSNSITIMDDGDPF